MKSPEPYLVPESEGAKDSAPSRLSPARAQQVLKQCEKRTRRRKYSTWFNELVSTQPSVSMFAFQFRNTDRDFSFVASVMIIIATALVTVPPPPMIRKNEDSHTS